MANRCLCVRKEQKSYVLGADAQLSQPPYKVARIQCCTLLQHRESVDAMISICCPLQHLGGT
jgi:hypothetical protein